MNRFRRLILAVAVAVGLASVGIGASPALASAAGGNCATNNFCLYRFENYNGKISGERWQTSFQNIWNSSGHCISIPPAQYSGGGAVADNSQSMQYKGSSTWGNYIITYYNWTGCNASGQWGQTGYLSNFVGYPNLNAYTYPAPAGNGISLGETITSIDIQYRP